MTFNKVLEDVSIYEAGKPIELVVREYGVEPKDIIKLASNENPYGTSPKVVAKLQEVSKNAFVYPDDSMYELKEALACKFTVNEDNIIIGAGSDQVIEFCVHAKCNENSKILMAKTTFAMYEIYGKHTGATILKTASDEHNLDEFRAMYKEHNPELIFLCLPNNPLGECLDASDVYEFLDEIDETAKNIDAVNTIKISKKNGKKILKGYNTDILGFSKSLKPLLEKHHKKALILGTGGAGKAVAYSLQKLNIEYLFVGRKEIKSLETIKYENITKKAIQEYPIIINCTPLGAFPDIDSCPNIPYKYIDSQNLIFDLVYNPEITTFMKNAKKMGANIKNGYEMLKIQADEAWGIFGEI